MIITYKSRKLEKILKDDKQIIKKYGVIAKKLKQRLIQLQQAESLEDIKVLPQFALHQLKGARKDDWAVTIQNNWRLCFQLIEEPPTDDHSVILYVEITEIEIISVEDYH